MKWYNILTISHIFRLNKMLLDTRRGNDSRCCVQVNIACAFSTTHVKLEHV